MEGSKRGQGPYTLVVYKPDPTRLTSGHMTTHSSTRLDIPLEAAKEATRAMQAGLPDHFLVELQDSGRWQVKV